MGDFVSGSGSPSRLRQTRVRYAGVTTVTSQAARWTASRVAKLGPDDLRHTSRRPARGGRAGARAGIPHRPARRRDARTRGVPRLGPRAQAARRPLRAPRARRPGARLVPARDGDPRRARPSDDPPRVRGGDSGELRLPDHELGGRGKPRRRVAPRPAAHSHGAYAGTRPAQRRRARARPRRDPAAHRAPDAHARALGPGRDHRPALCQLVPPQRPSRGARGGRCLRGAGGARRGPGRAGERRLRGGRPGLLRAHRSRAGRGPGADSAAVAERFRREAQLAARLRHPSIVSIYDIMGRAGLEWYTMELVPGTNLAQLVQAQGPLSVDQTVRVLDQGLSALEHAHALGLVHRDLKPENMLIEPDGRLRITDFGLALALRGDGRFGGATSRSGTPQFAAPEQLLGERVDQRADLYSLAAASYFALLGRPP